MLNKQAEERLNELRSTDEQLKAHEPDPRLAEYVMQDGLSIAERLDRLLSGYGDRPAFGEREYSVKDQAGRQVREYLPAYVTTSYCELRDRLRAVANTWRYHPDLSVDTGDFVLYFGFAGIDFVTINLSCYYSQAVAVPMQTATSGGDLDDIVSRTNPTTVAATMDDLLEVAELVARHQGIRSLIAFDYDERVDNDRELLQAAQDILSKAGVTTKLVTLQHLIELGQERDWQPLPAHPDGEKRLALIIHSSGSTGKPKGAMAVEKQITLQFGINSQQVPAITVSFAPLNHGLGIGAVCNSIGKGGLCYFTLKSDLSTLFEDIRLARPTHLYFFPRVFELIHQHYQNTVVARVNEGVDEASARQQVMEEMRYTHLGDRMVSCNTGGAPVTGEVRQFISDCFQIEMTDFYGCTEAGAVAINGVVATDLLIGFKLRDVPELGYYTTDKPFPRGEVCSKSEYQISGYFKDPEANANLMDEDGYILSGDIAEEYEPGKIRIIDRRKDVTKLSQGEYVAVGTLGNVFETASAVIHQIYVYGTSFRAYLLAVVVPNKEAVQAALGDNPSEAGIKSLIREELRKGAESANLKSFEVPRDFIIEHEPFTQANGLLSSVRKRLRPALKRKYAERLEAMYEEHDAVQNDRLKGLKDVDSPLSIEEKLKALVEINLSIEGLDVSTPRTFKELGGDSLGSVAFSVDIMQVFGVEIPANTLLSPTGNIQKWAKEIEDLLSGKSGKATFESVHGSGAEQIHASDLQLSKFIDESILQQVPSIAPVNDDERVVLVTGANGFLGRHVCLQWMERLAPVGGKVICIVRGTDDAAARQRVDDGFCDGLDSELQEHYQKLAASHLEVLAGDLGEKNLGLSDDTFARFSQEVDRISHVAALVNHRLGYEHLFAPNVAGTADLIKLAVTSKLKPFDFVSTLGVAMVDPAAAENEDAVLVDSIVLGDGYAEGYSYSKWAGEILLRKANEELGLPVNILRGNSMMAHQRYVGQINEIDLFTRILYSVIVTGVAPDSFIEPAQDGSKQAGHYDGSPVDVVAASVVAAANFNHRDFRAFNMVNYLEDDCSWDTFVDELESLGYPVSRVEYYSQWHARLIEKLHNLTDEQKQRSAIDIMSGYTKPQSPDSPIAGTKNYQELVSTQSTDGEIKHLDSAFARKTILDIKAKGWLND